MKLANLDFPKLGSSENLEVSKTWKFPKLGSFHNLEVSQTWKFTKLRSFPDLEVCQTWEFPKLGSLPNLEVSQTWKFPKLGSFPNSKFEAPEAGPPGSRARAGAWNRKVGGSIRPRSARRPPPGPTWAFPKLGSFPRGPAFAPRLRPSRFLLQRASPRAWDRALAV